MSHPGNIGVDRRVEHDWWQEPIPSGVSWGDGFYCETAQIFRRMRSHWNPAVEFGNHVSVYAGCALAVGEQGRVRVGDFTLLNGALLMAEEWIEIGHHCLISWNVGIADSDFHPLDPVQRMLDCEALAPYFEEGGVQKKRPEIGKKPVKIGNNVWIGMNATILKGVEIGDHAVVAAGAVVSRSVEAGTIVAGNPAKVVKRLPGNLPDLKA